LNKRASRTILPYLLILPAVLFIGTFKIFPIFSTLFEGFWYRSRFSINAYKMLMGDTTFWNSLWVTIKFDLAIIPFQVFFAIAMALLVNNTIKGIGIFRTIYYLPVTISLSIALILWNMMFNPNNGVVNSLLGVIGIPPQGFLINKNQALWSIVIINSWRAIPYWMMFILAGLKNIDRSIYESAWIDGAGWFTTTIKMTIPLIKRVLLFVVIANTTSNTLMFIPMQMLTKGGPQGSTNTLMYEAYKSAFLYVDRPRSAAIVTVLLFIIAITCVAHFKLLNEPDEVHM
jgi:multiple sugar transport system permease protein